MFSAKPPPSYRDILCISCLIAGVCFVTLTPAMYLMFHALQWGKALRIVETVFPVALFFALLAAWFTYQRVRWRRAQWPEEDLHE
jgi:hypothetical protein